MGSRGARAALSPSPAQLERQSISAGIGALGTAKLLFREKYGRDGSPDELSSFINLEARLRNPQIDIEPSELKGKVTRIDIGQNTTDGTWDVDTLVDKKLRSLGEYRTHSEAAEAARRFLREKGELKGDLIFDVAAPVMEYTGKTWSKW